MASEELHVKANPLTAPEVAAMLEARVAAAVELGRQIPVTESTEPLNWWYLYALGPLQVPAGTIPPGGIGGGFNVLPHKIIQLGQTAYISYVIWLNPFYPAAGLTACNYLSVAQFEYSVDLLTIHLDSMSVVASPPQMKHRFVPHQCYYTDAFEIKPTVPGIYEVHMTARIHDATEQPMAPFAAFATEVWDYDANLFSPNPQGHWHFDTPIRYMVYK